MNLKSVFQNRALRAGLCILLTALLLLSLLVPALSGGFTQLNKPDADVEIQDIQVLHTGDEENPEASSKENSSEADGQGNGQETDEVREDGREVNGESEEKTQGVSQQEKAENIGGIADPQSGPAVEDLSNATVGTTSSTDDMGEEGQNDGKQGDEGGEEVPLDAVAVMSWQKYGREERSIVCQGGSVVAKKILLAQLDDNVLEYDFYISGSDAEKLRITGIKYAIGDSVPEYIDESGSIDVAVPTDPGFRNYIFTVEAIETGADSEGRNIEKPVDFTFVIRCETGYDLELQLHWEKADTGDSVITCSANDSAGREINRSETGSVLKYSAELVGGLAENSSIIAAEYTTASGGYGTINTDSGTLELSTPEGSDRETYYLRFTAETKMKDDEGDWVEDTVSYTVSIVYIDNLDLQLSFKWYEKGISERELICDLNSHVTADVKLNQLSAGALIYKMELTGKNADNARIRAVALQHDDSSQSFEERGSAVLSLDPGEDTALYKFLVTVLAGDQTVSFTVAVRLSHDIRLRMDYELEVDGELLDQQLFCENGKTVTAETVYDDQLDGGNLSYSMSLDGEESSNLEIIKVQCYQSGSMKNIPVAAQDSVTLLLDGKRTGENRFTVTAVDSYGENYIFTINIPYKHRGENLVKITTNLQNGMQISNETEVNLKIHAWTEDANGNVVSTIRNQGSETILRVSLDSGSVNFVSSSGDAEEFILIADNPKVGDQRIHTLTIYAQDEFGNYGEEQITLVGKRSQRGQENGTAQIYIDMTAIGLGRIGPINYTILVDEPVSYVVAKAVWGYDAGFPFGTADETFGFQTGTYKYTFDEGFELESLSPGGSVEPIAMYGRSWREFGETLEEQLAGIDAYFGEEYKDYATLWRCIRLNGLNLSNKSDSSVGKFDFTSGSGWSYAVGTGTDYPGLGMSEYSLKDGEILTLRYCLANGWDIGGGSDSNGNTVGYCVTALNGSLYVDHKIPENSDTCTCCGRSFDCTHDNKACEDGGDGYHYISCVDCGETMGSSRLQYVDRENPDTHTVYCDSCGMNDVQKHDEWFELSNSATCTEGGFREVICFTCGVELTLESEKLDHVPGLYKAIDAEEGIYEHYQECYFCGIDLGNRGAHDWSYVANEADWKCVSCGVRHDWDYMHMAEVLEQNCLETVWWCPDCQINLFSPGDGFSHYFENGSCSLCGEPEYAE